MKDVKRKLIKTFILLVLVIIVFNYLALMGTVFIILGMLITVVLFVRCMHFISDMIDDWHRRMG